MYAFIPKSAVNDYCLFHKPLLNEKAVIDSEIKKLLSAHRLIEAPFVCSFNAFFTFMV